MAVPPSVLFLRVLPTSPATKVAEVSLNWVVLVSNLYESPLYPSNRSELIVSLVPLSTALTVAVVLSVVLRIMLFSQVESKDALSSSNLLVVCKISSKLPLLLSKLPEAVSTILLA